MSKMLNPVDLSAWDVILKYMPMLTDMDKLKTVLLAIDLPQEFIDKAIISLCNKLQLCCCMWWTFQNLCCNRVDSDIYHQKVWTVYEKLGISWIYYLWKFNAQLHGHLKKWTHQTLICYIYWAIKYDSIYCINAGI